MTGPPDNLALPTSITVPPARVVVPYVAGYLRAQTSDAVATCGVKVEMHPLEASDPYNYAKWLQSVWNTGGDLIVVEHDMVPTAADVRGLVRCEAEWCAHFYHVGMSRYVTGLGFCKFGHNLQRRLPLAAVHAASDPRTGRGLVPWQGLNEAIERTLVRRKVTQHVHEGYIPHLHYPEVTGAQ